MCIVEFIVYTCGHRSIPVHRPCPMTTHLHTNPVCPPHISDPDSAMSPSTYHNASSVGQRTKTTDEHHFGPSDTNLSATAVRDKNTALSFSERATYADAMCTACSRILHANWVNIVEYEHRWMHERGACSCPVVFPELMGPRVIGGSSHDDNDDGNRYDIHGSKGMAARKKGNNRRMQNQPRANSEYEELEAYQRQRRGKNRGGDQHDLESSDNTVDHTSNKSRRARKNRQARWNGDSATSREDSRSSPSTAAPLFQEHVPINISNTHYHVRQEVHYTDHEGFNTGISPIQTLHYPEQQQLRVSIRLPSLYAAEWTQDHRVRHEEGLCQCPVSFERYLALDEEYGYPDDNGSANDERQETSGGSRDGSELEMSGALEGFDPTEHYLGESETAAQHDRRRKSTDERHIHARSRESGQLLHQSESSDSLDKFVKLEDDTDTALSGQHSVSSTNTSQHPGPSLRDHQSDNHELSFMERTLGPIEAQGTPVPRTGSSTQSGASFISARSSRSSNGRFRDNYVKHSRRSGSQHEQRVSFHPQHSDIAPRYRHEPQQHRAADISESTSRFTDSREHRSPTHSAYHNRFELNQRRRSQAQYPRLPLAGFPIGAGPEGHSHAGGFDRCMSYKRTRRGRPSPKA